MTKRAVFPGGQVAAGPTARAVFQPGAGITLLAAALSLGVGACWHDVDPNPAGGSAGTGGSAGAGGSGGETSSSTSSATGGTTGSTTEPFGCQRNADCVEDPAGPICNLETGECVSCLSVEDPAADCGIGAWCHPVGQCEVGCTGDADCPGPGTLCDAASHTCVGCLDDGDCPAGSVCEGGQCLPGCNEAQPCAAGDSCCFGQCKDLQSDEDQCGACGTSCPDLPHAVAFCNGGVCEVGPCSAGFQDCNGALLDGCETNTLIEGDCLCTPSAVEPCYLGAPGTEGVGACKAGTRTCKNDGLTWSLCLGQVLPAPEICANGLDESCDGTIDNAPDQDLDGWTTCDGDCNDHDATVNPGAWEIDFTLVDHDNNSMTPKIRMPGGNGKDDDCNPATLDSEPPPTCSDAAVTSGVTALALASALDLCQTTLAGVSKAQQTWGLLSAELLRADGSPPSAAQLADLQDLQTAVLTDYGTVLPHRGPTFAGLSTGAMRDAGGPGYVPPSPGTDLGWSGSPPAAYLAANGNQLPGSSGCSGACPGGTGANDGVLLRLQIRVPTNAGSFSLDHRFFSAEAPANLCTNRNDFALGLLTSAVPGIPLDKNVLFDTLFSPLSVNNAFFDVCSPAGCLTCPAGSADLAGTGMPAGVSWLQADVPVVRGETMTLDLTVFDVSDGTGDSALVADHFRWSPLAPCCEGHP